MNYTIIQKALSVIKNIYTTNPKQYWFFFNRTKKAKQFFEDRFAWDLTKEEDYDGRDYTFDWSEELPELNREATYMVDQWLHWRTRNACVPISMMLSLYHNANLIPNYNEIKGMLDYLESKKVWFENNGASAPLRIRKLVPKWNELHPESPMEYRRVQYWTDWYDELLNKWYRLAWGRKTFREYTLDVLDRVINNMSYNDETRRWGHYIWVMKGAILNSLKKVEIGKWEVITQRSYDELPNNTEDEHIINQYPTQKWRFNIYAHAQMASHVRRAIWYSWFYAILPVGWVQNENYKEIPRVQDEEGNRYYKYIKDEIKNGYTPIYEDHFEKWELNAWEVKTLIEIYNLKK